MEIDWKTINTCLEVREKLDEIVNIYNSNTVNELNDYLDTLSDTECRVMLRMIIYGDWEKFK